MIKGEGGLWIQTGREGWTGFYFMESDLKGFLFALSWDEIQALEIILKLHFLDKSGC